MTNEPVKKVLIVGCGIAGLTLAIALRQRKVEVEILEKTSKLGEVGAAISLAPNSTRILQSLNFDSKRARCTDAGSYSEYNEEGVAVDFVDLHKVVEDVGAPWWLVHRADLHEELTRLATEAEDPAWGPKAALVLDCQVVEVDTERGIVVDQHGKRYQGDLIVGADGVRSVVRQEVTGRLEEPSIYSGHSAYRSLYSVEELLQDPVTRPFVENPTFQNWVGKDGRRCLLYPCRDNTLLNLFAPTLMNADDAVESWRAKGKTEDLIEAFKMFPERLQKLLAKDPSPALWQIRDRNPVRGWQKGKAVLIGDAAHAMLPHQGQGASQSIEDASTLPIFLLDAPETMNLTEKLKAFEEFRYPRVTAVQERSRAQKEGPHERLGRLPSILIWEKIYEQTAYDVREEAEAVAVNLRR
ncbi:hypothetical protein FN846DRAFT_906424 [Sphaerosporella brunnea]|uniref:FAD-binding domain-containing protein n=1 Tax=Sphaerosporella brunnea TaxID=1250544 RepID=A0A5J5EYE6_9PEZI|nr:hypothetical protein FN846DRAFT_906424 [Sphaerosporella brunnea]